MDNRQLDKIRALVGEISEEQLRYVDCFVAAGIGLFIPSVGPCFYAITPDHSHPAYSFILTFDDNSRIVAAGTSFSPAPGTVLAMDPLAIHHEVPTGEQPRYIAIMVSRELHAREARQYFTAGSPYAFRSFLPRPELVGLLKEFMTEHESALPGSETVLEAIAIRIVHSLLRAAHRVQTPAPSIAGRIEINRVIEYLHQRFGDRVTVEEMAAVATMSPSHFSRVFRRETGTSPMNYLIDLRLAKARRLIVAGERCVTTVALRCGFASPSHFTDSFRKRFGCPPSDVISAAKAG